MDPRYQFETRLRELEPFNVFDSVRPRLVRGRRSGGAPHLQSLPVELHPGARMPPDGSFHLTLHDVEVTPAGVPDVFVDHTAKQVLSLEPIGDVFYGLIVGTNGTAAEMRRRCAPDGYTWIASDCRTARGVFSVPSDRSDDLQTNPWSGRP